MVCNNAQIIEGNLRGQPTEGSILACAMKVSARLYSLQLIQMYLQWIRSSNLLLTCIVYHSTDEPGISSASLYTHSGMAI